MDIWWGATTENEQQSFTCYLISRLLQYCHSSESIAGI
uniref:Uncharacterized protein n=1 Tax=Arundo donax TaxID=35708 RepID=A0A0A9ETK5_ARUDO